jgi:3-phenylpropionate/trans-cinnamate dioxygenase ferredoxin reductase subunit
MGKLHTIRLGAEAFHARSGQLLLDAALAAGVDMPHDCRAGRCGSCLTCVEHGMTLGGSTLQAGMIHACQARVFSDLSISVEQLPPVSRTRATLLNIHEIATDILEVTMKPERPLEALAGQYCKFTFRGCPPRPFSPTASLKSIENDGLVRLNIKRVRGGRVTNELGRTVLKGQAVTIEGPFGHAFLRPGSARRLVLIGSGTGFAPMWSVAAAALSEDPSRSLFLIGATRTVASAYMAPALELAMRYPNVDVRLVIDELKGRFGDGSVVGGNALDNVPAINGRDIVYAAGAPKMVEAVGACANGAGAIFYADPFKPMAKASAGWLDIACGPGAS